MSVIETQFSAQSVVVTPIPTVSRDKIICAAKQAEQRIAPLWPLRNFVAVNPFLGLADVSFATAAQLLLGRAGARMTAPRAFYARLISDGRITDADLAVAIAKNSSLRYAPKDVAELKAFAFSDTTEATYPVLPTVADVASTLTGVNWADVVTDAISAWAGAYFDLGQSYWRSPWSHLPAYSAWRAEAIHDRSPQVRGLRRFRQTVQEFPETALETIVAAVNILQIPSDGLEAYLHRLLLTIHGWASYARYLRWNAELYGGEDSTLTDLLAIRIVWEVALWKSLAGKGLAEAWHKRKQELSDVRLAEHVQRALAGDILLQQAFEKSYQRQLFAQLGSRSTITVLRQQPRKRVQAAFCIDVRSEVFRRALETVTDEVETIGFAGFFGFPIEYVPLAEVHGGAQCPVLLTPQFVIAETVEGKPAQEVVAIVTKRAMNQRVAKAWRMFKFGPVSCFGFVGPVGLAYVRKLLLDTLGITRPVPHPAQFGLDAKTRAHVAPGLDPQIIDGRTTGMSVEQRVMAAAGALKAMSLTNNFARMVLLAGHGSTTVNNPHATALDCGACGGHTGEANVRVAVRILNDPEVRTRLREQGIMIPNDTVFVAGLHDTTTDDFVIFDKHLIPTSHAADLKQLEADLAAAGRLARAERAVLLKIDRKDRIDKAIRHRSKDWSQVRPEWGLAGCAAFIAAPRERTAGVKLDGRTFLHSYHWQQDTDFSVLELIMTAPMIVASWINLQYYGSTVDNRVFGSGNKTLHNVVGTLGVLEGNSGDLRVGLPWQSVHDGSNYVHEPLRLHVLIEAPIDAMTAIIAKHEQVRQLLDNGWLYLFALDEQGNVTHRYAGHLQWEPCGT